MGDLETQAALSLWDIQSGNLISVIEGGSSEPYPSFTAEGTSVFIVHAAAPLSVRGYDVETEEVVHSFEGHTDRFSDGYCVQFTPDGSKLLTVTGGGAQLWDVASGSVLRVFYPPGENPDLRIGEFGNISRDGSLVAAVAGNRWSDIDLAELLIWETGTGDHLTSISMEESRNGFWVDFSPAGSEVLTTRSDGQRGVVEIRDVTSGWQLLSLPVGAESVWGAAFSPDGTKVLTGCGEPPVAAQLWDATTGQLLQDYELASVRGVSCVAFSPNGTEVLACVREEVDGDSVSAVRVWDAVTGETLRAFEQAKVWSMDVTTDGTRLITAAREDDDKARIWDYDTGELLEVIEDPVAPIRVAVFSPDGTQAVTSTAYLWQDGDVLARLWDVNDPTQLQIARDGAGGVILTWQNLADILQQCPDLSSADWSNVTVTEPGRYEILDPAGTMFYRLEQP